MTNEMPEMNMIRIDLNPPNKGQLIWVATCDCIKGDPIRWGYSQADTYWTHWAPCDPPKYLPTSKNEYPDDDEY